MEKELKELMSYLKIAIPIRCTLFEVPAKVGENSQGKERIFGSINSTVADAIMKKIKFNFFVEDIKIPQGIKTTGYYEGDITIIDHRGNKRKMYFDFHVYAE